MKKILIAGTSSSVGKTTISLGLMAALKKRGMKVQPFKVGPDYIDPSYHTYITGEHSRNLDSFMLEDEKLKYLFNRASQGKDISIVEGVMGLYDGRSTDKDDCSSSAMAKLLKMPVILVIDAGAMGTSSAAMALGYKLLDPEVNIAGVIANNVRTESHYQLVKKSIEAYCQIPVVGYFPPNEKFRLSSRHLGLIPSHEMGGLDDKFSVLADEIEKYIDLDRIVALSESEEVKADYDPLSFFSRPLRNQLKGRKAAVAYDKAFHFYYQDNLELMEDLGIDIVYFSPLEDEQLPECDYIYIGGGFPELFAPQLEKNVSMRRAVCQASEKGVPVYAECGGLMYLGSSLVMEDREYEMAGVFKGRSQMTQTLQRFGYCRAVALKDNILCDKGEVLCGHEFHHSEFVTEEEPAFEMQKSGMQAAVWQGGYSRNRTLASYLHIHFYGQLKALELFLSKGMEK